MPNTKSAMKAMRQSSRRRTINLKTKTNLKAAVKQVKKSVVEKKPKEALAELQKAYSALDKASKKGVIHKNTASRKKSRLAKAIAKMK